MLVPPGSERFEDETDSLKFRNSFGRQLPVFVGVALVCDPCADVQIVDYGCPDHTTDVALLIDFRQQGEVFFPGDIVLCDGFIRRHFLLNVHHNPFSSVGGTLSQSGNLRCLSRRQALEMRTIVPPQFACLQIHYGPLGWTVSIYRNAHRFSQARHFTA